MKHFHHYEQKQQFVISSRRNGNLYNPAFSLLEIASLRSQ